MCSGAETADEPEDQPWDDWWPEEQTALDVILEAARKAQAASSFTAPRGADAESSDDEWAPATQGAASATSAGAGAASSTAPAASAREDAVDSDDDWAPTVQGAADVRASEREALEALLFPTYLAEREKEKLPFATQSDADKAGKQLCDLKRPPTVVEAKETIPRGPGVDVEALPEPALRALTEEEGLELVRRGASLAARGQHGRAPLHSAAEAAFPRLCRAICDAGVEPDVRDKFGETPLHLLAKVLSREEEPPAEERRVTTIEALLEKRADVNAANPRGKSVLHLAATEDDHAAVGCCLAAGALADARDLAGFTPLMWAAGRDGVKSVRMLLDARADAEAVAKRGQNALSFARDNGNTAVAEVLQERIKALLAGDDAAAALCLADDAALHAGGGGESSEVPRPSAGGYPAVYSRARPDAHSNVYSPVPPSESEALPASVS
eukprot:TRINITY_DN63893_c0_g1_i1.p1 TRINITY_DN63893_c0_g1~~TRINITY_DN63893_c0_g1_i1.p1  ORF type:complete len:442 (+),score=126.15 TRINITY_DN63893_c0_g1_i1:68-1393(+)